MPSHAAMIKKVKSVSPQESVEKALKIMGKEGVPSVPVVGEGKAVVGVFSMRSLLKNLLPVEIAMGDGSDAPEVLVGAAPGIAKRLRNAQTLPVESFMERQFPYVLPTTPIWKTIELLVKYDDCIYVVDDESGKLSGVITSQSAINELERMQN